MYVKGRIGDIADSTEIILREQQRIVKAKKCIQVAQEVINTGASENARSVT